MRILFFWSDSTYSRMAELRSAKVEGSECCGGRRAAPVWPQISRCSCCWVPGEPRWRTPASPVAPPSICPSPGPLGDWLSPRCRSPSPPGWLSGTGRSSASRRGELRSPREPCSSLRQKTVRRDVPHDDKMLLKTIANIHGGIFWLTVNELRVILDHL